LAGFKAHRGAGGDIQAIAGRLLAIELQRRVDLGEVVMRADLNRPVAVIFNDNAQVARPTLRAIWPGLTDIHLGSSRYLR
jgi:hypothetical protein